MNLHHQDNTTKVIHGDCIETMNQIEPETISAIVTDPPYGLGFMGRKWDALPPSKEWAEACYRVLKPGGHIAAFGGTRTWHRLAVAIEDAGFEMRDSLAWLYGSGFPKSHDVSKAIDKLAGAEREVIGRKGGRYAYRHNPEVASHAPNGMFRWGDRHYAWTDLPPNARDFFTKAAAEKGNITAPATPAAEQWDGWGTALKPAFEPIVLARKPLAEKTVARNVLEHGTGAINVDGCRIGIDPTERDVVDRRSGSNTKAEGWGFQPTGETFKSHAAGRWPANVVLDHNAATWVDEQSGNVKGAVSNGSKGGGGYHGNFGALAQAPGYGDQGGASRFFRVAESDENGAISPYFPREFDDAFLYTAKAPKRERPNVNGIQHPTVKPLAIMEWLIRLVTPPSGTVLDPFAGSGTTLEAARKAGFTSIGIEAEETYLPLIDQRLQRSNTNPIELEGIGE